MYSKMLVPLDGSELAEAILPYAIEVAGRMELDIILVHVCETDLTQTQHMCHSYIERIAETARAKSAEVQSRIGLPPHKTINIQTRSSWKAL